MQSERSGLDIKKYIFTIQTRVWDAMKLLYLIFKYFLNYESYDAIMDTWGFEVYIFCLLSQKLRNFFTEQNDIKI